MAKTLVINLFAGPRAGKRTCAWQLADELTRLGYRVEYIPKYSKELLLDDRMDMLDGSLEHQQMIFKEQNRRIQRMSGKVDIVITDSPLLLSSLYCKEHSKEFDQAVRENFLGYDNFNLFVNRGNVNEQGGNSQSQDKNRAIDEKINNYLHSHEIFYGTYDQDDIERIALNIQTIFNRINGLEPVQREKVSQKRSRSQSEKNTRPVQNSRFASNVQKEQRTQAYRRDKENFSPSSQSKSIKYDLNAIREIPIDKVLADRRIKLERNNYFKIQNQRSASIKYYPDRNAWYDFSMKAGGGVIKLVMKMDHISAGEAIQKLGRQYHIQELSVSENMERFNWLTSDEFQLIGIDANNPNRVLDNTYSIYTLEQAARLQQAMNLPMNELLEKSPEQYKAVLEAIAFPYVQSQQMRYFSALDSLAVAEKNQQSDPMELLFCQEAAKQDYEEYKKVYAVLRNGANNVKLDVSKFKPDFSNDLKLAKQGKLRIEISDYPYSEYRKLPGPNVYHEITRECYSELKSQMENRGLYVHYPFCAFLQDGKVNMVYKSPDKEYFEDLIRGIEHYLTEIKPDLDKQRISKLRASMDNFNRENHELDTEIER